MKKSFVNPTVNLARDEIYFFILSIFSRSGFSVTGTKASDNAGIFDSISTELGYYKLMH